MAWSLAFEPLVPMSWLITAGALALALVGLLAWRRRRGAFLRAAAFALILLALANPLLSEAERTRLPAVAAVIIDETASQKIAGRLERVSAIRRALAERLEHFGEIELRWTTVGDGDEDQDGTRLFAALNRVFSDVPPERIAGAILVSDGLVHDIPKSAAALGFAAPLHLLLGAPADERDRRVVIRRAPRFALVGRGQTATVRVEDSGALSGTSAAGVRIDIRRDGEALGSRMVRTNSDVELPLDIVHGGRTIFEIEAEPLAGELTRLNNRAVIVVEGVRENLRVLLVSGEPHAGERTWRNLLKSDAAVDLVHFTILRPPEKQDGTPINQLSLIALPTRELFSVKIDEFDLIILDRYQRRGVLPVIYFDNIARYVREGGALLVSAGPELARPVSIYRSPLSPVIPAQPSGMVFEEPYRPAVSARGARHPVTRDLPGAGDGTARWGRWLRAVGAEAERGETVMSGPRDTPLLVLSREGEGRVALLLSDHAWLWSRGYDGGGPQIALLRRLSHWLMREPELEEERLSATSRPGKLIIERQTMAERAAPVRVTAPDGGETTVELKQAAPGLWRGEADAPETGLYRLADGQHTALAPVGEISPKETAELLATPDRLAPLLAETGGGAIRVEQGVTGPDLPRISLLARARQFAGNGWIALKKAEAYRIDGVRTVPLMSGLVALALLLAGLGATWYREGR